MASTSRYLSIAAVTGLALGAFLTVPAISMAEEEYQPKATAFRIEVLPIDSVTVSDEQFLKGDNGAPVTVAGVLRIARPSGRTPLMIFISGSGGFNGSIDLLGRQLEQMGISTFALDGFAARGITNTVTDQSQLGRLNMIVDLYRSLSVLSHHRQIDPERIAVMGFSRGGQVALYSSLRRFQKLWNTSGVEIAAYISLFGPCNTTFIDDTEISASPVRLFHGQSDDYVEAAPCRRYVERLRQAGKDVTLTEYPDTWHGFDYPSFPSTPITIRNAETNHCQLEEDPLGTIKNVKTDKPFSSRDNCVGRNPHLAYSASATLATEQAIRTLLRSAFRLGPDPRQ
jgi:dienelactone hydrolase